MKRLVKYWCGKVISRIVDGTLAAYMYNCLRGRFVAATETWSYSRSATYTYSSYFSLPYSHSLLGAVAPRDIVTAELWGEINPCSLGRLSFTLYVFQQKLKFFGSAALSHPTGRGCSISEVNSLELLDTHGRKEEAEARGNHWAGLIQCYNDRIVLISVSDVCAMKAKVT